MKYLNLIFVVLLAMSGDVFAEGGCPDGTYPANPPATNVCYPFPDSENNTQPQARWATRWGAIAFDGSKGILGAATGAKSKKHANKAAVAQCRANGGGENCKKSPFIYNNQCAAVAWGDATYRGGGRPTLEEAKKDALQSCSNATTSCKIVYAACSLAERVY